eukprot:gene18578-20441_t
MGNEISNREHEVSTENQVERPDTYYTRASRWLSNQASQIPSIVTGICDCSFGRAEEDDFQEIQEIQQRADYEWWGNEVLETGTNGTVNPEAIAVDLDTPNDVNIERVDELHHEDVQGKDQSHEEDEEYDDLNDISIESIKEEDFEEEDFSQAGKEIMDSSFSKTEEGEKDVHEIEEFQQRADYECWGSEVLETGTIGTVNPEAIAVDLDTPNDVNLESVDEYHYDDVQDKDKSHEEDEEFDDLNDITIESIEDEVFGEEDYKKARKEKMDGLFAHLEHFSPKGLSVGSDCPLVASLELESANDLKVVDIVTEEQDDCTVASIIINQAVAREMALEKDTSANFIQHSSIIAHNMWRATKYICPEWKETEVEIGGKACKILTAQMILPKSPKMFEYSYGDAKFCKFV